MGDAADDIFHDALADRFAKEKPTIAAIIASQYVVLIFFAALVFDFIKRLH